MKKQIIVENKTAIQIGGFSMFDNRVWLSGLVLEGSVGDGDKLNAVGLKKAKCEVEEVLVDKIRRRAVKGEECQIFLKNPDESLLKEGTKSYIALLKPRSFPISKTFNMSLHWASASEGFSYVSPDLSIYKDTKAVFRFADIKIPGIIKKPARIREEDNLEVILDKKIPIIPGFIFSANVDTGEKYGGSYPTTCKILGPIKKE